MELKNQIMLITYSDTLGKNLKELSQVLKEHFTDAIGGVHILPFFPSSADRGFAPMTYEQVDSQFGSWEDLPLSDGNGKPNDLMYDFMINHLSKSSDYYKDLIARKDKSPWRDLFLRPEKVYNGKLPDEEEVGIIYKRKPRAPFIEAEFEDGTREPLWCTFGEEQIDLDVNSKTGRQFIKDNLIALAKRGARLIRLDAFAYAIKKPGTNCFFVEPDIWELLDYCAAIVKPYGVTILPEIHEHYSIQLKIAEHGYYVYDFALPMLVLHGLYTGRADRIVQWMKICPRKQFTTLDTHDGIGVVDVKDLLTDDEMEETRDMLYTRGANVKPKYSSAEYNNLDIYQINCSYYSALGNQDDAYLLARAVQFFAPGIPQVYYVGMLAGENDIELLEKTKEGRNINRHAYTREEVEEELKRPVVQKLMKLMRFRNSHPAFNGNLVINEGGPNHQIQLCWELGKQWARLNARLDTREFTVTYSSSDGLETCSLEIE